MRVILPLALLLFCLSSCSSIQYFYVVRHAEKDPTPIKAANGDKPNPDPQLSAAGKQRAEALKERLSSEKIQYIFSTNTIRTRETAEPTRAYFQLQTQLYAPMPADSFITRVKNLKGNILIVGHSNTVDDVVNKLTGEKKVPGDLPETEYNNLFIIKKKKGKMSFEATKYGK